MKRPVFNAAPILSPLTLDSTNSVILVPFPFHSILKPLFYLAVERWVDLSYLLLSVSSYLRFLTPTLRVRRLRRVIDVVSRVWPSRSYRNWNRWWDIECTLAGGTGCCQLVSCSSTAFFLLISQLIWATCAADSSGAAVISINLSLSKNVLEFGIEQKCFGLLLSCTLPGAFCCSSFDNRDGRERPEGGVRTCDKGCVPDWRVHGMHLSHLRRKNTTTCHSLKPETQQQRNHGDREVLAFLFMDAPFTTLVPDAFKGHLLPMLPKVSFRAHKVCSGCLLSVCLVFCLRLHGFWFTSQFELLTFSSCTFLSP